MKKTIKIGHHLIRKGSPPFIIAEAGINHNGDMKKVFTMIDLARKVGVSAVKFQTFKASDFIADSNLQYTYKSQGQEVTESMLQMFERCELTATEWREVKDYCDARHIVFLSTPQNCSDLSLLMDIGIDAIKVGSDDIVNLPLLKKYSQTGLPLILSCGMADLGEIFEALECVGAFDGYPVVILLCTSQYPTPSVDVNLSRLKSLQNSFAMVPVGYSDHTQGSVASVMAVSMGAVLLEKHFTLDHNLPGPDHWFSENPVGLERWVSAIKESYLMMGSSILRPTEEELKMRTLARRSVVAKREIARGEMLTEGNITLKRPGNGLKPSMYENILGRHAVKVLHEGVMLEYGDFI